MRRMSRGRTHRRHSPHKHKQLIDFFRRWRRRLSPSMNSEEGREGGVVVHLPIIARASERLSRCRIDGRRQNNVCAAQDISVDGMRKGGRENVIIGLQHEIRD